ncbi:hypothetical protein JL100_010500 [Skermanella mucosa]|uniref:hypothetical protein n=1 Tax=Skermanella mucosa TaxID=1789672 RepID=UPI00192BAE81|nr:hypothetical protein [Skermanella mucosa]UEM23099.1 hypothetical protein JL100_010270 [Skermanella mucosa]UEM23143.1 hypothetical protein JL100_010500 [Skermanella mucosa]
MRAHEFISKRRSHRHEHVAVLYLDPTDWNRFRAFAQDRDDVVILDAKPDADRIAVQCGCQSVEICDRLQDAWN